MRFPLCHGTVRKTIVPCSRILAKENACWYKSLVSRHDYNEGANGKQALKAIFFFLNRFTSHRATKPWGSRELLHSDLFSSLSNDSK